MTDVAPEKSEEAPEKLEADLQKSRDRIVNHMNEDHGDSILAYVHYHAQQPDAKSAELKDISAKGMTIDAKLADGSEKQGIFVPYSRPLTKASEIRPIVVDMHYEAYHTLGFKYKLEQGYYKRKAIQHAQSQKKNPVVLAAAQLALLAIGGRAVRLILWR